MATSKKTTTQIPDAADAPKDAAEPTPAKKTASKSTAKKAPAKKATSKTTASKTTAKKAAPKKAAAKKAPAKKAASKKKKGAKPTQDQIAKRAYEIYEQRGGTHGADESDWHQAEKELRGDA